MEILAAPFDAIKELFKRMEDEPNLAQRANAAYPTIWYTRMLMEMVMEVLGLTKKRLLI